MVKSLRWNPPKIPRQRASFLWDAPHAAYVHEHPERPRPWVDVTLADVNIAEVFRDNYTSPDQITVCFFNTMEQLGDEFTLTIDDYQWSYSSNNRKRYIPEYTWQTITDSGDLADSLTITFTDL